MEIVADMIQDMADYLNIKDMESTVDFPEEIEKFQETIKQVDELVKTKEQLSADMADNIMLLKRSMMKGEDCRIMGNMKGLKSNFANLRVHNETLMKELRIRQD